MQFCDGVSYTLIFMPPLHIPARPWKCSFATVYHSLYATVAYSDMQRWHKVYDTPSHLSPEVLSNSRK